MSADPAMPGGAAAQSAGRGTWALMSGFFRTYPWRSLLMLGGLLFAGVSEGIGLAALLPLLDSLAPSSGGEKSMLAGFMRDLVASLGLGQGIESLLLFIVLAIAVKALFLLLAMNQVGYTAARVTSDLRMRVLGAVVNAGWGYFVSRPVGTFANSISTESVRASQAYYAACNLIADLLEVVAYTVLAMLVSWKVALALLIASPLLFAAFARFVRLARQAGNDQTDLQRQVLNRLTDGLQGIKPIKAMAQEKALLPLLEQDVWAINTSLRRQFFYAQIIKTQQEPVIVAGMALMLYFAMMNGGAPFAELTVLALLFYRLAGRIGNLQKRYQTIVVNESAYWSLQELVVSARECRPPQGGVPAPDLRHGIRLDEVSFAYPEHTILDRVSATIPAHAMTVITGPSGAGKTTLADLVVMLQTPHSGHIYLDDTPYDAIEPRSWQRRIGYVPQEMTMFHDTLRNNVTLREHDYSDADVRAALFDAGLGPLVDALPEGLETVLGERGSRLSGGQRQRVAIARALIRKPTLLVLDEVTTSLDPRTEKEICNTFKGLAGRLTIIAVSHQPALTAMADAVFELRDGQLVRLGDDSPKPGSETDGSDTR